ncbi:MAG: M20 family peptidase [Deltaproteobacteria bacterium]|nr:M20 family peptidase [Deltaproteobacteria bacterium]
MSEGQAAAMVGGRGAERPRRAHPVCLGFGGAFISLLALLAVRAATMESTQVEVEPLAPIRIDESGVIERFRAGLQIRTVSHQDDKGRDEPAFFAFHTHLAESYPRVHAALERERVSELTLLYRWRGREPALPAVVLLAHQDVVPVDAASVESWTHPPFESVVADGFVWGRGALDDKLSLFAVLEAVEGLLADGYQPRRDVYLAFGHDEELGGEHGAVQLARILAERRVDVGLVLDEGGAMLDGLLPGLADPVAIVGVAEKGYLSLTLSVAGKGGHSSSPPPESLIGILSSAIRRLERDPFPSRLDGAARAFFERGIGPESPFLYRLAYANLWLTSPLVQAVMLRTSGTGTMLRTTTAPTIFHAGLKDNVLPARAEAVVNFRLLPGDSSEGVIERVRDVVDDPRVEIRAHSKRREPSEISRMDSAAFRTLARSIREIFPGTLVAPFLVIAGTDSRYFHALCDCVYRFLPLRIQMSDMMRVHGTDERVPVDSVPDAVRFYRRLIENASAAEL